MPCLKDDIPEQAPRTQAARTKQTNEDAPDMQRTTPSEKAAKFCSRIVPSQHDSRNYLVVYLPMALSGIDKNLILFYSCFW